MSYLDFKRVLVSNSITQAFVRSWLHRLRSILLPQDRDCDCCVRLTKDTNAPRYIGDDLRHDFRVPVSEFGLEEYDFELRNVFLSLLALSVEKERYVSYTLCNFSHIA